MQDLQDQRAKLRAAAQAMQQHKVRAAFAAWLDFLDSRARARDKALSALRWFTQRCTMQAMASWKVRDAAAWCCVDVSKHDQAW